MSDTPTRLDGVIYFKAVPMNSVAPPFWLGVVSWVQLPKIAKIALEETAGGAPEVELDIYRYDGKQELGAFVGRALYVQGKETFYHEWTDAKMVS